MLNGVLADSESKVLAENADGTEVNVTSYCQVPTRREGLGRDLCEGAVCEAGVF